MSDSLDVKIKTTYEEVNAAPTLKSVKDLQQAADKLAVENAKVKGSTDAATTSGQKYSAQQRQQIEIAQKLTAASRGSAEGIGGLMKELTKSGTEGEKSLGLIGRSMQGLTSAVLKAGPIIGALYAGINAGGAIFDNYVAPAWDKITKYIGGINPLVAKSKEHFDKLNETRLDKINNELEKSIGLTDELLKGIDSTVDRITKLSDAQSELEIASIKQTMPEGPDRDKKIAEIRHDTTQNNLDAEIEAHDQKLAVLKEKKNALWKSIEDARTEINAAKEEYDRFREQNKTAYQQKNFNAPAIPKAQQAIYDAFQLTPDLPLEGILHAGEAYRSLVSRPGIEVTEDVTDLPLSASKNLVAKQTRRRLESAKTNLAPAVKEWMNQLSEVSGQIGDTETLKQVALIKKETAGVDAETTIKDIDKKQKDAEDAELRRVQRQLLQNQLEKATAAQAKEINKSITEVDIKELSAAARDNKAKAGVLGWDIGLKQEENEKSLRAKFGPDFERVKSASEEAQQQALEARGAGAVLSKNPRDKSAAKTYEREKKEADDAQKKLEAVVKELALGNQETLDSILQYLQQAEAKNKQVKDQIRRLPL